MILLPVCASSSSPKLALPLSVTQPRWMESVWKRVSRSLMRVHYLTHRGWKGHGELFHRASRAVVGLWRVAGGTAARTKKKRCRSRVSDTKHTHGIHSGPTPPQSQRGRRSVLVLYQQLFHCYGNARLGGWIVGFVSPVPQLICLFWHTLKPSRHKVDLSACESVRECCSRLSARKLCVSVNVYRPLFVPYRYAANCRTGSCSFKAATKGSLPKCSLCADTLLFLLNEAKPVVSRQSMNKRGGTKKGFINSCKQNYLKRCEERVRSAEMWGGREWGEEGMGGVRGNKEHHCKQRGETFP